MAFLGFFVVIGVGYLDSMDGEVREGRRGGLVSAADDPEKFRGALILNYGMYAIGALVASVVCVVGGSAVANANRSSKP
jgi:hypothetical protein